MRGSNQQESSTPYCRCRVLYLGSSVPHASKEGLLGVQEPLRELYPEQGALGARGIDSWLSVWSNGLLLENVDEYRKKVTRFFPIEALHYCAAVRHVKAGNSGDSSATRFFPLDSPFARTPSTNHPPLFAAVLRRTTGIKVLECHAFICKRDMAANALVRCCFHAYADCRFAKGLELPNGDSNCVNNNHSTSAGDDGGGRSGSSLYHTLGGSSPTLTEDTNGGSPTSAAKLDTMYNDDESSLYDGDDNHKVWARGRDDIDGVGGLYQEQGTLRSIRGSRPRQLIAPPPPPPPPPTTQPPMMEPESSSSLSRKKASKKLKKLKNLSLQDEQYQQHYYAQQLQMQQAIYANGHHTLVHPMRRQQQPLPPPHSYHHHHHRQQVAALSSRSIAGTMARPAPVLLVPASTLPRKGHHHHSRAMRQIVQAAAPIVPIYTSLPVAVPPPPASVIYPGGYGTTGNRGNRRQHHMQQMADGIDSSTLGVHSRRMAASHADLSVPSAAIDGGMHNGHRSSDSPENDSRFGTGIYRRKGHLNERAFSYSIRAEHRSRSHGSLASLGFAGGQQNDSSPPPIDISPKQEKKDREMAQLVAGLSIDNSFLPDVHYRGPPTPLSMYSQHQKLKNGSNGSIYYSNHHHHNNHLQQQPQPLPRPKPR